MEWLMPWSVNLMQEVLRVWPEDLVALAMEDVTVMGLEWRGQTMYLQGLH